MPTQLRIRSEESKKHCKAPQYRDIAEITGNVGYVVAQIPAKRQTDLTITIVEITGRYRYTALCNTDVLVVHPAFRSPTHLTAPERSTYGERGFQVVWETLDIISGTNRSVLGISCDVGNEYGEDYARSELPDTENAFVLISEEVADDA